jgi:hypothetical protein
MLMGWPADILEKDHPMKRYLVQNDEGLSETLEVAAETELGFHVKISVAGTSPSKVYRDFISRALFETLVKAGTLEPLAAEARAG